VSAVEGCGVAAGRSLREDFETWRARDLADEDIRYVFMDGWYPKVRIGGRRERVPVLVTLGVRANGDRVANQMASDQTVIDGNPGLSSALRSHWPGIAIQRCTGHKLRNLQAKAAARLREELTEDYRRMIYGETVAGWNTSAHGLRRSGSCGVRR